MQDESTTSEQERIARKVEGLRARLRHSAENIFDAGMETESRRENLLLRLQPLLEKFRSSHVINTEELETVMASIRDVVASDKRAFVEEVEAALAPILRAAQLKSEKFEKAQREIFVEQSGFIPVNEALSYGVSEKIMHIHLAPIELTSLGEKLKVIKEGFEKLAEVVKADNSIEQITGTSWIIAKSPKIMERFGFVVEGEIDEQTRQAHFADETRSVWKANMSREAFLAKYLMED